MRSNLKSAYLAGFFDGEGYVGINHTGRDAFGKYYFNVRCIIGQKHPEVLEVYAEIYEGRVYKRIDKRTESEHFILDVSGKKAERMLRDILPYSIEKKEQIKLALEAREILTARKKDKATTYSSIVEIKNKIMRLNSPMGFGRVKPVEGVSN